MSQLKCAGVAAALESSAILNVKPSIIAGRACGWMCVAIWSRLARCTRTLWLAAAAVLELLSIGGYATLFRAVFGRGVPRIDWRVSLEIPLAGIAAIRLVAAAGAGGVAVTAWALGRAGMSAEVIACRMVASLVVLYSVYLGAVVVCGVGLWAGIFGGGGSVVGTWFVSGVWGCLGQWPIGGSISLCSASASMPLGGSCRWLSW
jgi:hypothetical protein